MTAHAARTSRFARGLARLAVFASLASLASVGCGPPPDMAAHGYPKAKPCPSAVEAEPPQVAVVVGTIGKMHLVESGYALTRLGDVLVAFKPDLVLVAARVPAYREGRLEEASFEITYVDYLAKQRGIPVEPIDWYRDEDVSAPPAAIDPWDAAEIVRRETEVLGRPRAYTFELANGKALEDTIFAATNAEARYRSGNPRAARRNAWLQHLSVDATVRRQKPKRVLAVVDVLDRPVVDLALRFVGYVSRDPVKVVADAKETVGTEIPEPVSLIYKQQATRARERAAAASGLQREAWAARARVLEVAFEKRGVCCVPESSFEAR